MIFTLALPRRRMALYVPHHVICFVISPNWDAFSVFGYPLYHPFQILSDVRRDVCDRSITPHNAQERPKLYFRASLEGLHND